MNGGTRPPVFRKRTFTIRGEAERDYAIRFLGNLTIDRVFAVTIAEWKPRRSLDQNDYYHWILGIAADHTGIDHDDLHEEMKRRYCPAKEVTILGETRMVKSTKRLEVPEMIDYIDRVQAFFTTELGIVLPAKRQRA